MTNCSTYHDVSKLFVFMSFNVSLGTLLVLAEVQINDMLETIISYVNDISHRYDTESIKPLCFGPGL
jgi:hypothetical protein